MILHNTHEHHRRLKERFLILQDYARLMFLTEIGKRNCVKDGVFSSLETECLNCDLKTACKCLTEKEVESVMQEDLIDLIEKMQIAKNYVKRKVIHHFKEDGSCDCDSCSWLAEFDKTLLEVFYLLDTEKKEVAS